MEKNRWHTENTCQDYILGRMSGEEETAFEEHLLGCSNCRKELAFHEKLIAASRSEIPINSKIGRRKTLILTLGVAAGIAVLTGIGILLRPSSESPNELPFAETLPSDYDSTSRLEVKTDETAVLAQQDTKPANAVTANFTALAAFENAIRNPMRSSSVEETKPSQGAVFFSKDTILFDWKPGQEPRFLVIFNNKGEIVLEKETTPPYTLEKKLTEGLYYWQIETPDESLFTGKFLIR